MRIRQIKPSFWEDALIDSLPDAVKLFYIGTWQLADDGGTFEWNIAEVGRQLYGYKTRVVRERWVRERGQALVDAGRLVIYDCGHAFVKRLTEHQHLPGKKTLTVTSTHARKCPQIPATARHGQEGLEGGLEVQGGAGGNDENPPAEIDALRVAIEMNEQILLDPEASEHTKRAARKFLMSVGVAA